MPDHDLDDLARRIAEVVEDALSPLCGHARLRQVAHDTIRPHLAPLVEERNRLRGRIEDMESDMATIADVLNTALRTVNAEEAPDASALAIKAGIARLGYADAVCKGRALTAEAQRDRLLRAVGRLAGLQAESNGVSGYHLSGDIATWDGLDLMDGLTEADIAAAIKAAEEAT